MLKLPPQTIHPPTFSITSYIFSFDRRTGANISKSSAVPPGVVIAREELLGILNPAAAIIGTTIKVVLVPGIPPIECLSATIPENFNLSPVSTIALVK
ncbi:MAG: hypothetical protein ACD_37C00023G0001 [uncultured bacterium]|nr:MAG: hypothetical protein ACD_37C00023G0001 [uncultured bacterium]